MIYEGQTIKCSRLDDDIVELKFDADNESVNKFNEQTLRELRESVNALASDSSIQGMICTSGKDSFIVGADINSFLGLFKAPKEQLLEWVKDANKVFNDLEDLDFPTVSAINGYALGGGMEFVLATTYRVASTKAKVGLPETKLGIFPGFGGTVRLSRVIGSDNAIEWIATGKDQKPEAAFKAGAVDAVVAPEKLRDAALHMVKRAISGEADWKAKRQEKLDPIPLGEVESIMVFEGAKAFIAGQAGPHYPAPVAAVEAIRAGATKGRDGAMLKEHEGFVEMAQTPVAANLVSLFLGDQYLKREAKKQQKDATPIQSASVLGAGIMGGGVAYQSAYKGIPIFMKDINVPALELGLGEASKLLSKLVDRKRIDNARMAQVLTNIHATLSYGDLKNVDIVVEAVVEKEGVKKAVLAEIEEVIREDAVLTSNTSTISITKLAEDLKRPELFCGMHFFNPVYKMPLVEVIRGEKTGDRAVAQTVAYASAMGKTPIVVNDCPGFLVNRVLFPYLAGFLGLVNEGVDFRRVDKVMEKFGWPMGPAYLIDVVGIDTAFHAATVMNEGFPDRMKGPEESAVEVLFNQKRLGQKTDKGFYLYTLDKKGKQKKTNDPDVDDLLKPLVRSTKEVSDEEIIDRLMMPMVLECSRCLEDKIVQTPQEVDMGLIYGLGFPPFRGGAFRYVDSIGVAAFVEKTKHYSTYGKLYEPTEQLREMAQNNQSYY